jgi:hypothetical protein
MTPHLQEGPESYNPPRWPARFVDGEIVCQLSLAETSEIITDGTNYDDLALCRLVVQLYRRRVHRLSGRRIEARIARGPLGWCWYARPLASRQSTSLDGAENA